MNQKKKADGSNRKRANHNQDIYRIAIQNMPVGYAHLKIVYNLEKKIDHLEFIEVNQNFLKLLEIKETNVKGKRVEEIFPAISFHSEKWLTIIDNLNHGMKKTEFKHYMEHEKRWLYTTIFSPKKNYIIAHIQDITTEISPLITYENFFSLNLDLLFISDKNGNFVKLNKEWEYVLGYSVEELESTSILDLVHPEDVNGLVELIKEIDKSTEFFHLTVRFHSKGNGYHYIELKGHIQGEYIYCAARDISDRIELEHTLKMKNTLLQSILDNAPVSIYINYPEEDELDFYNKYVLENYAMTKEECLLSGLTDEDVLNKGFQGRYDEEITFKDGKKHIVETIKTRLYKEDGSILGTLGIGLDITKRMEYEEALRMSESKYRLLTETTSDAIWVYNMNSKHFTYVSPTIQMLRGYTVEETMEQTLEDVVAPEYYSVIQDAFFDALKEFKKNQNTTKSTMIETQILCKNGKRIWSEMSARLRYNQNNEIEVVGVSRNIESRKQYEEEVLYLSYHDQLTGLYNRRYYEEELKRINVEDNYPITLVMADVNGLKLTNDAFGHVFGDRMLVAIADILRRECRSGDIIARIGGDEFVFLLPRANSVQAEKIVDRIQSVLSDTMVDNVKLSVSFGWKTKYMVTEEFDEIYKQAEDAMYRCKMLIGKSYKSDTIKLITKSLYAKSTREQLHCERVSMFCKDIGAALGMDADDINELGLIGLLHDIGKIGINADILNKNGALTEEEWQEMKRHPEIGYHILRSVNEFAELAEYVLAHHERIDGKGYPYGLNGTGIPLKAKILHVAEAFEIMTGEYTYREKLSMEEAAKELKKNSGTDFDDVIVKIFIEKVLNKGHE